MPVDGSFDTLTLSARSAISFAVMIADTREGTATPADLVVGIALESGSTGYQFLHQFPRLIQAIDTRGAHVRPQAPRSPFATPELVSHIRRALEVARVAGGPPGTGHLLYSMAETHPGTQRLIRSAGVSVRRFRRQLWAVLIDPTPPLETPTNMVEITSEAVLPGGVPIVWDLVTGFEVDRDVFPGDYAFDVHLIAGPEAGVGRRTRATHPNGLALDAEVVFYEKHSRFVEQSRIGGAIWCTSEISLLALENRTRVTIIEHLRLETGNVIAIAAERQHFVMFRDWYLSRLQEMLEGGWPDSVALPQTPMPAQVKPTS
ncbi:hypothetical protein [Microbacterium rhizomatis]|uniref:Uncharacterized protein n=1 Tax=Microbacterium rhizomatis TaxID=1631477 RepID=A0A5J5J263_9MICO|nr:hypothetical protein [Microbacterium rhizomatis]KAA9110191.1 hypothetical protein F6B43_00325 [Microbacterium rhizomatis]